ncbi:MAG: formate--tetrahydrofolate ligase [Planctomycetaceae bacterium]|jgi:formate--tetrahydrofolate ligase|nr:formate--tetrahydrofolate ligase [Planctomycetaceae bacterium]
MSYLSDLEISRRATLLPINAAAEKIGLSENQIERYGNFKAKISFESLESSANKPDAKLILVTAISPTPAGEGKTTTSIGLADALNRIGKRSIVCLREPSMGPCFGMKGGATGGGYAQVVPMEEINLHFTGDFHAISSAHNLLAAMLDNNLHFGNSIGMDERRIVWNRVVDLNDRALRKVVIGLGGALNSIPRESSYDITVASEVMAIFCLSNSLSELKSRLGKIIIGYKKDGSPVVAADLKADGSMTALLRDALKPNIVQTLEGNPAIIHGGPFANIAHGCNSVLATKFALKNSDYVVTEAGFGADLGAEKFFDIKCRQAGLKPDAVVIVATVRALKYHGGVDVKDLHIPNIKALESGFVNLSKHVDNMRLYGLPVVVAINAFPTDTPEETQVLIDKAASIGIQAVRAEHWARGGEGAEEVANVVVESIEKKDGLSFKLLYSDETPLLEKVEIICRKIYGADGISIDKNIRKKFDQFSDLGFSNLPVCIAKTQYSFSTDPTLRGCPKGFTVPIRDAKISSGAGFVVVLTGDLMTMPGLSRSPAAEKIDVDKNGQIIGLF